MAVRVRLRRREKGVVGLRIGDRDPDAVWREWPHAYAAWSQRSAKSTQAAPSGIQTKLASLGGTVQP